MLKEEQIRNEVIKVARELFDRYGFNKTSMEDIAKATGRGKSTLYYYYSSKDEIFEAVSIVQINKVYSKVKEAIDKAGSAEEKMQTYILTMFKETKKSINLMNNVSLEIFQNLNRIKKLRNKIDSIEAIIVRDILNIGIKNKEFCVDEKNVDKLASTIVRSFRGLEIEFLIENKVKDWESRVGLLISILVKGLKE